MASKKALRRVSKRGTGSTKRKSTRSSIARRQKKSKWLSEYLRMSKAQLLMVLDPEMSFERVIELSQHSKRHLAGLIRAEIRRQERAAAYRAKQPCPKGHEPGDPACDLTCWITNITPYPNPMLEAAPRVTAKQLYDAWPLDPLSPSPRQQRWTTIMAATMTPSQAHLEKMAALWKSLYDQFDVGVTLDRNAGWWWRRPYGRVLSLWRKLCRVMTRES